MSCTARLVRESAHNRTVLLSEREVRKDLQHVAREWVQRLGTDAERLFRPMMRFGLNVRSRVEYPAAGPFAHSAFDAKDPRSTVTFERRVVSWRVLREIFDRRDAWPSPLLIQLLGAYGMSVLESRPGAKGDPRRAFAVDHVVKHLGPFVAGQPRAGKRVYPKVYGDPRVHRKMARREPVPLALAAQVAIYIGAPGREDPEYDGKAGGPRRDADILDTASTAVDQLVKLIRRRLPADGGK